MGIYLEKGPKNPLFEKLKLSNPNLNPHKPKKAGIAIDFLDKHLILNAFGACFSIAFSLNPT